ncbi:carboxylesterase family protein [Actinocorallia sp. API 0066]|nr:carboxylesterase family protein [Actinocorallia sp. API 0066]
MPHWRGVPYARVERRFRPAVPVAPGGPIEATAWGPVSWQLPIQVSRGLYHLPLNGLVENEDCLNLNVWSPGPRPDGPLPVLVWFHGGSRVNGSASSWIDPWHFAARHGVVVVTANYRLGPWGCLYLGGHDPDFADSANLEALDQVMLLRWIGDNIAGFGGDPGNVTLFGVSSGGSDVATLLGTPAAHGLFHRAAIYSGNAEVPVSVEAAVRFTDEFLAAAGPLAKSPEDLARLPNVGLRYIHGKLLQQGVSVRYRPFVDGAVVPRPPLETIRAGGVADVPLLVSVTSDEAGIYVAMGDVVLDRVYNAVAAGETPADLDEKTRLLSKKCFWEPADRLLRAAHRSGGKVWLQRFCYAPTNSSFAADFPAMADRPVHGTDMASLFVDTEGGDGTETDRLVGAREQNALITLAREGRPPWPEWSPRTPVTQEITAPSAVVGRISFLFERWIWE